MRQCFWCGLEFSKLTRDHVVPKAHGGQNKHNIVMACQGCNNQRSILMSLHCDILNAKDNLDTLSQSVINRLHRRRERTQRLRDKWVKLEIEKLGHSPSEKLEFNPPGELVEIGSKK